MTTIAAAIPPSGNGAASVHSPTAASVAAASSTPPYVQLKLDGTYGLYISEIGCAAFRQQLNPTWLWRGVIRTVASGARTLITTASLTFISQTVVGNVITLNFTYGGWLTLALTITASGNRLYFGAQVTETGSLYALECHEWPRFAIRPYGVDTDTYFFNPVYAGGVIKGPSRASQPFRTFTSPSAMQCWSVYDAVSAHQLYFQTDDTVNYYKQYSFQGDGSAFQVWWTHYPADNQAAGKGTHSLPYQFWCEPLVGKGTGWTGFVDTCDRYRSWALSISNAFLPAATWKASTAISAAAKAERVFVVPDPNTDEGTSVVAEVTALVNKLGTTAVRVHVYGWHANEFDHDWPAHLPPKAWAPPAVKALVDLGINPLIYTINVYWNITNTDQSGAGVFDFYGFDRFGNLSDAVFQDGAGVVQVAPEPDDATFIAFNRLKGQQVAARVTELCVKSGDWERDGEPTGAYLDQITGAGIPIAAVLGTDCYVLMFDQGPALAIKGNSGLYGNGKGETIDLIRSTMPDKMFVGESVEEPLIGKLDFQHSWSDGFVTERGMSVHGFGRVYSQYQRLADLACVIYPTSDYSFVLLYLLIITLNLHYGMPLAWNHIPQLNPFFKDNPAPTSAQGLMIGWVQLLLSKWEYFQKYHEGELLRPMDGDWYESFITSGLSVIEWWSANGHNYKYMTSVWRCPEDGDIGIIVTTDWPSTTSTVRLKLNTTGWPLPVGAKALYQNVDGVRTLLTSFNHTLDYEVQVTGPGVYIYEIALLP